VADIKETVDGLKEIADSKNDSVCECLRCKKIAENALEVIEEAYTTIGRCYSKIDELIEKEWTSVDERLPEEDGFYLVCNYGYLPWIAELKTFKCIRGWCNGANMPVVKMWMPLPKTPKDGEQK